MAGVPSQYLWAFFSSAEPLPNFAAAPADAACKDRILLLAKYAMQNGPSFVDMVKTNQGSNPEYSFLKPGSADHAFFRWALYAMGCGLPVEQPPPQGFAAPMPPQQQPQQMQGHQQFPVQPQAQQQQHFYGMQQQYPQQQQPMQFQQPHALQQPQQAPPARPTPPAMPTEVAAGFSQVLDSLSGSKDSIKASQGWFMACAPYAAGMAYMMASRAVALQEFDRQLHLIYLANDILFKAMQQQQGIFKQEDGQQQQPLDPGVAAGINAGFVPAAGVMLAAAYAGAQAAGNADGSSKLDKMLAFWRDKGVFDAAVIARLQSDMCGSNPAGLLLANYPPAAAPQPPPQLPQPPPQQPSGWGPVPAGTPPQQPPQGPVSGGWGAPAPGAPSPHMPAAPPPGAPGGWGPPAAFQQQQQPYPQQPSAGWGQPQPPAGGPWGPAPPAPPVYPPAGQPHYPAAVPPAGPPGQQYPGAVAQPYPPAVAQPAGAVPPPGHHVAVPQAPPIEPQPVPVSSFAFPPGLIPQLSRDKSKYSDAYASIEPAEIDKAGLPPPPEKDAYLKSRMEKFMLELRDYRPGSSRADLEEARAAARAQQGLEPDSDEELALGSTGSRMARRKALGMGASGFEGRRRRRAPLGPVVGGMAEDGSYVGPGGGRGERLGLGAHSSTDTTADLGDVYSSYRKLRSTSYHQMIVSGAGVSNMGKGG